MKTKNDIEINIINLESNKQRWQNVTKEFDGFKIKRFNAIQHNKGWKGCTLSHIELIKKAKLDDAEYIIISEDDTVFFKKDEKRILEIIDYLEKNLDKWEVFQFGTTSSNRGENKIKLIDDTLNIIEYDFGFTTNFIIYNKSVYDLVISFGENMNNWRQDVIDVKLAKSNIKFWTVLPFVSYQADGYSNIENTVITTRQLFLNNEKFLKSNIGK